MTLPEFLIKRVPKQEHIRNMRRLINDLQVHTVCESAKCPNIGECFSRHSLTFMILGNICARHCSFCNVLKGAPLPPDPEEPKRIAQAVEKLGLKYVVVTSVTRDDLPDGGASQFAKVIQVLKTTIEVLVPDFQGHEEALKTVLDARPFVLNHNLETVPRLYPLVRPQANYQRSLNLLQRSKQTNRHIYTKSGFMVGLGETRDEILKVLEDLTAVNCDLVTIGQYLSPSKFHLQVERYVQPEEFEAFTAFGENLGLKVYAGPFVRSSYRAEEQVEALK